MHSATVLTSILAAASLVPAASGYVLPFPAEQERLNDLNSYAARPAPPHVLPRALVDQPAAGSSSGKRSFSVPLMRKHGELHPDISKRDPERTMAWAFREGEHLRSKYQKGLGIASTGEKAGAAKRQLIGLTDVGEDSYYYAQVSVGTPAQNFNIILDTGSADFWVVDSVCGPSGNCAADLNRYNPSASSSHVGSSAPFQIQYGTGAVAGNLAADIVSLAGYTVNNLTFAQADRIAPDTIDSPASGIMGMGFQTLASSVATPFWEVLAEQGTLETNAFTFQLARNIDKIDYTNPDANTVLNPGGVFTLGRIDSNQYSGNITYIDIPNNLEKRQGLGYWTIPLQAVSVNGQDASIGNGPLAAIDTGTTLIGGPQASVQAFYSLIPGSRSAPGSSGYYLFPCDANLNVQFTFGGQAFTVNTADINLGRYPFTNSPNCLGALFDIDLGGNGVYGVPQWIVGDAFLKNVFSVFDYQGRVGFANLKGSEAQTAPITTSAVPSGTAVSNAPITGATATASALASASGIIPIPSLLTIGIGSNDDGLPTPSASGGTTGGATNLSSPGRAASSGAASLPALSSTTTLALGAFVAAMVAGAGIVL